MIVVSNTTPLIGLAVIQRFDLLRQMFGTITIAPAVWDEAVTARQRVRSAVPHSDPKTAADHFAADCLTNRLRRAIISILSFRGDLVAPIASIRYNRPLCATDWRSTIESLAASTLCTCARRVSHSPCSRHSKLVAI